MSDTPETGEVAPEIITDIDIPRYSYRDVTRMINQNNGRLRRVVRKLQSELASIIAPRGSITDGELCRVVRKLQSELTIILASQGGVAEAKLRKEGTDVRHS